MKMMASKGFSDQLLLTGTETEKRATARVHWNDLDYDFTGCSDEVRNDPKLRKYWTQRYKLFSKFDLGIKMDTESWYSVTPEYIATRIAQRCKTDGVVVDGFCGVGGNTIQFAKYCGHVIAIDIDPIKIEYAKHNAKIYGVEKKITFIVGDFMEIAKILAPVCVVFLSPPWGGPGYLGSHNFDLKKMKPYDGCEIFKAARKLSKNIAYYLPRTVDISQVVEMKDYGSLAEVENNVVNGVVKACVAYFGRLVAGRR